MCRTPGGIASRPTLLFMAACALSITPHEAVRALTSYLLGFSSTLFQMWVNPDPAEATSRQLATIAAAGPIFSLAVGVTCWLLCQRRFRRKPAALMFFDAGNGGHLFLSRSLGRLGPWGRLPTSRSRSSMYRRPFAKIALSLLWAKAPHPTPDQSRRS